MESMESEKNKALIELIRITPPTPTRQGQESRV